MTAEQTVEMETTYIFDAQDKTIAKYYANVLGREDAPEEAKDSVKVTSIEKHKSQYVAKVKFYLNISDEAEHIKITQVGGAN